MYIWDLMEPHFPGLLHDSHGYIYIFLSSFLTWVARIFPFCCILKGIQEHLLQLAVPLPSAPTDSSLLLAKWAALTIDSYRDVSELGPRVSPVLLPSPGLAPSLALFHPVPMSVGSQHAWTERVWHVLGLLKGSCITTSQNKVKQKSSFTLKFGLPLYLSYFLKKRWPTGRSGP